MGNWRFRKSIKIAPGIRLNASSRGKLGVSVGVKGARVSVNAHETRTTLSVPGTGIQKTTRHIHQANTSKPLENLYAEKDKQKKTPLPLSNQGEQTEGFINPYADSSDLTVTLIDYGTNEHEVVTHSYVESPRAYIGHEGVLELHDGYIGFQVKWFPQNAPFNGSGWDESDVIFRKYSYIMDKEGNARLTIKVEDNSFDRPIWYSFTFKCTPSVADAIKNEIDPKIPVQNTAACFVATSVYGTNNCFELDKLRNWRDSFLAESLMGQKFIKFYYKHGKDWSIYLDKHPKFKQPIRRLLDSFIFFI